MVGELELRLNRFEQLTKPSFAANRIQLVKDSLQDLANPVSCDNLSHFLLR